MNAERVGEIFIDCLFRKEEVPETGRPKDLIEVDGLTTRFGLHPGRLFSHKAELQGMIDDIHPNFTKGGGWTFMNLCLDKDEKEWTGFQQRMQELFVLCAGLGMARYQIPREFWSSLPGGVPYIEFNKEGCA